MDRSTADTRHGFARLARFGKALRAFARDAASIGRPREQRVSDRAATSSVLQAPSPSRSALGVYSLARWRERSVRLFTERRRRGAVAHGAERLATGR